MIAQETILAARDLRLHLLKDPYRPAYHFVVPEDFALPADPNGAIFWNGRYHLGYIYQNQGVHYWGHVSSLDLLHWRHHPPWLFPTPDSPEEGIFSGNCFINRQGEATMLYHGVKVGNCIATSSEALLDAWRKLPTNPIVPVESPDKWRESATLPYASWDPHGWLEGDTYYAIFGGTRPALFKAHTLGDWTYVGDFLAHGVDGVSVREDVSCPDFFRLGDKWVLMCISHELGCRYYVGDWRNEQFHPELHERMSWADNTLFAPESLVDAAGRRIMWAWIFDQWDDATREASGWSGVFSLPRELWLGADHRLRMRPVEELKRLRYNERRLNARILVQDAEVTVQGLQGNTLDFELVMEPFGIGRCGVKVCCSTDGEEETVVGYDAQDKTVFIDTNRTSRQGMGLKSIEAAPFQLSGTELLHLRVLVDKSVIEVFANDRQSVLRRVYPSHAEASQVKLFSQGCATRLHSLTGWEMMPSNPY
jgi:beta-fructofuranosidase